MPVLVRINTYKMILRQLHLLFLAALILEAKSQPAPLPPPYAGNQYYYRTRTIEASKPTKISAELVTGSTRDALITAVYYDFFERELQTVIKKGALSFSGQKDMVGLVLYDSNGRESSRYLPFASADQDGRFKINGFQQQKDFYNQLLVGQVGETNVGANGTNWAYYKTVFEPSALGRPVLQFSPGSNWVGSEHSAEPHAVFTNNCFNKIADSVRVWKVMNSALSPSSYVSNGIYEEGKLIKTVTVNEHGVQIIEFTNGEGLLILRKIQKASEKDTGAGSNHEGWNCIYYMYDEYNQLRAIVQPMAVERMSESGSWTLTALDLHEQVFQYVYDSRLRQIIKKIPGSEEVFTVFDYHNRPVLMQDGNMRTSNKWLVVLYDVQDRVVVNGLVTINQSREQIQQEVDARTRDSETTPILYEGVVVNKYPLPSTVPLFVLSVNYYDQYDWASSLSSSIKEFDAISYENFFLSASNLNYPFAQPVNKTDITTGMLTGTKLRVLEEGTEKFVTSVFFYDDNERLVQTRAFNITSEVDVKTIQYSWGGKVLRIVDQQKMNSGSDIQEYIIVTKMNYDELNRLSSIVKSVKGKVNGTDFALSDKEIVKYEYDDLGHLKKKTLGSPPLETQEYDYNIREWLLGMNRKYINGNGESKFGFDLGYDKPVSILNNNNDYASMQYDGKITGQIWKSSGDGQVRKYDYQYDKLNRLTGSPFSEYKSGVFSFGSEIDFSMSGVSYDANGNLLTLNHNGWKPGGSVRIDSLSYNYYDRSNKLKNVIDFNNDTTSKLGDFRSSGLYIRSLNHQKEPAAIDYAYDANGNLTKDLNKDIGTAVVSGIVYNHLNLPSTISFRDKNGENKGTINYVYDAKGVKLKKIIKEQNFPEKVTIYLNGLIFENDTLQFINHEEGRIRNAKKYFLNGDSARQLVYDYYIKDHLNNIRMVLTEQQDTSFYFATLETAYREKENALFFNLENSISGTPPDFPSDGMTTNPNDYVTRLNGSGQKKGPGIVLRVMSGDSISLGVKSYFRSSTGGITSQISLEEIVASLADGIVGQVGTSKGSAASLQGSGSPLLGMIDIFRNEHQSDRPLKPRAYLNWIVLNDQLQYVPEESGVKAVETPGILEPLVKNLKLGVNGFLYVFLTNETENQDVYFNDLVAGHFTGPLVEETHYYPFGLSMSGITSKSVGPITNKYRFGGKEFQTQEFNDNSGLELYDFSARNYDPQIGRWYSIDPAAEKLYGYSPYSYSLNNPALYVDPNGEIPIIPWLIKAGAAAAADMLTQAAINYIVDDKATWGQSFDKVNWWQVGRSGLEGLIPWKTPGGAVGKAALTAVGDVLVNALSDPSGYTSEKAGQDFAVGFIGALGGEGFGELVARYGAGPLAKGLVEKLGLNTKLVHRLTGAWYSKMDNNFVGELANKLGKVVDNIDVDFRMGDSHGDIDILTAKFNIEVKSGKSPNLTQSDKNKAFAQSQGKGYILYMPKANAAQVYDALKKYDVKILRNIDELKKELGIK